MISRFFLAAYDALSKVSQRLAQVCRGLLDEFLLNRADNTCLSTVRLTKCSSVDVTTYDSSVAIISLMGELITPCALIVLLAMRGSR